MSAKKNQTAASGGADAGGGSGADLAIVYRALAALRPSDRNSRTHSAKQIAQIEASLVRYGWTTPLLIAGDGIIAGHARHRAASNLLAQKRSIARHADGSVAPTIDLSHLSASERRAYLIADNKLATQAGWDNDMLRIEMAELQTGGFDLTLTGFSMPEIGTLLGHRAGGAEAQMGSAMKFQIVIECEDEAHQAELLGEFAEDGLKARPLII